MTGTDISARGGRLKMTGIQATGLKYQRGGRLKMRKLELELIIILGHGCTATLADWEPKTYKWE